MGRDEVDGRFEPRRLQIEHQTRGSQCWRAGRPSPGKPLARRFMPAGFRQILTADGYVFANRAPIASREYCVAKARRLNPAGFSWGFLGKVHDVTVVSKELCTSSRAIAGRQGSCRPSGESDIGIGRGDRGNRRKSKEDEQVGLTL